MRLSVLASEFCAADRDAGAFVNVGAGALNWRCGRVAAACWVICRTACCALCRFGSGFICRCLAFGKASLKPDTGCGSSRGRTFFSTGSAVGAGTGFGSAVGAATGRGDDPCDR